MSKIIFYTRPGTGGNIRAVIASAVFISVAAAMLIVMFNPFSLVLSISIPAAVFTLVLSIGAYVDHKRDPIRYLEITRDFLIIGHRSNCAALLAWDTIENIEMKRNGKHKDIGTHHIKILLKDSEKKKIPLRDFFRDQKETIINTLEAAYPQKKEELKLQAETFRDIEKEAVY